MCTVSFVPTPEGCIITSNRDEHIMRKPALPPATYKIGDQWFTFPKDMQAGGTWYVVRHDLSAIMVLLNGAFKKHSYKPPYRKSRGLILLDLISHSHDQDIWEKVNLNEIEPFTIIYYFDNNLKQWTWDGEQKHLTEMNPHIPHIWSSSTLYEENIQNERKIWFDEYLNKNNKTPESIFRFHRFTNTDDTENGLIIQRRNGVRTQNITQVYKVHNDWQMTFENLDESYVQHAVPE